MRLKLLQVLIHIHTHSDITEQQRKRLLVMTISCWQPVCKVPSSLVLLSFVGSSSFLQNPQKAPCRVGKDFKCCKETRVIGCKRRLGGNIVCGGWLLPVDPWAPTIDSESIASQLFAVSLFPYIGFLYFITKSKSAPKLTLFGFYFLLAFVGATSEFLLL